MKIVQNILGEFVAWRNPSCYSQNFARFCCRPMVKINIYYQGITGLYGWDDPGGTSF